MASEVVYFGFACTLISCGIVLLNIFRLNGLEKLKIALKDAALAVMEEKVYENLDLIASSTELKEADEEMLSLCLFWLVKQFIQRRIAEVKLVILIFSCIFLVGFVLFIRI